MKYYQDITLLSDADVNLGFIWHKVYQQIHLALVENKIAEKQSAVAVSFPEYGKKQFLLGDKLRLFAPEESVLIQFDVNKWLARLSDYVHCTSIRPVPGAIKGYAIYRREQPKTNRERLARRYARRHGMDFDTALRGKVELTVKTEPGMTTQKSLMSYGDMPKKSIATSFIRLNSLSSGNTFCLWIKKSEVENCVDMVFTTYGLSTAATVPEF